MPSALPQTETAGSFAGHEYAALRADLVAAGFRGDVADDGMTQAAFSTDNSIYRIEPDLVVAPRDGGDLRLFMQVAARPAYRHLPVTARGGGTGTNGQSLNRGVIVNFQKYMTRILEVNAAERWVDVEPGVVLSDLNARLAAEGLMFGPTTSTASRCTLGGMVATDASGKGSRRYGKTGDNVLGLDLVLSDGTELSSMAPPPAALHNRLETLRQICADAQAAFRAHIPALPRRFTGYDLDRALTPDGLLDWKALLVGAEGTLGLVTRIRLRLVPRPAHRSLAVLAFDSIADALSATPRLIEADPLAVEVMDALVYDMAQEAGLLADLPAALRAQGQTAPALTFVEFTGNDPDELHTQNEALSAIARTLPGLRGQYLTADSAEMARLWSVRSESVGLIARSRAVRVPVAFIEDCAVPPERLSDFVRDLTGLLDRRGLSYGIYGHADAGCVHVRPALDLATRADRDLLHTISDETYALVEANGGIFWGEHGKGLRGAYLQRFLGEDLYAALIAIRQSFDPALRLNPGKLVGPDAELWSLADTPMRKASPAPQDSAFAAAARCNGNALCLNSPATTALCPSFKATRDLRYSPKGRAEALNRWQGQRGDDALARELAESLDLCLACKSCTSHCPVSVDIPEMRSRFLDTWHTDHRRRAEDHVLSTFEAAAPVIARFRSLLRLPARLAQAPLGRLVGLRDLPTLSRRGLGAFGFEALDPRRIAARRWPARTVILLPDPFVALFDTETVAAIGNGLQKLGYRPVIGRLSPGGKAAHNLGLRRSFEARAGQLDAELARLEATGLPLIAIDPAFLAGLRHDHPAIGLPRRRIVSVQQFLATEAADRGDWPRGDGREIRLMLHCSESAPGQSAGADWATLGRALGLSVRVEPTGCCGMAGYFGHQDRHQEISTRLYDLSWRRHVESGQPVLASGFSCRCQAERMSGVRPDHPLSAIVAALPTPEPQS